MKSPLPRADTFDGRTTFPAERVAAEELRVTGWVERVAEPLLVAELPERTAGAELLEEDVLAERVVLLELERVAALLLFVFWFERTDELWLERVAGAVALLFCELGLVDERPPERFDPDEALRDTVDLFWEDLV